QGNLLDLAGILCGNKAQHLGFKTVFLSSDAAVAKAVTALVKVQGSLYRLLARIPDRISLFNIKIMAIVIIGNIVVPITGDTQKLCIFIKAVAAAGIGNKTEKAIGSQIIDPRQGS